MTPISVVIIARNEEKNIGRCLASVQGIADDVVVVDSFSTDRTEVICREAGARFVQHAFEGHVQQKNWAVTQAKFPHVLSLDADEALSDELKRSVLAAKADWRHDGYWMNRLTNYCGTWVRHCGWYPDEKLRLWDSRLGAWTGVNPHDHYQLRDRSRETGFLAGDLLHYSYYTVAEHYRQQEYFAAIAAGELYRRGDRVSAARPALAALARFTRNYLLKRGFLDGATGWTVCRTDAWGAWRKYKLLRELQAGGGAPAPGVPGPGASR